MLTVGGRPRQLVHLETIELVNDGTGLGFGIVGGKTSGVIVKTILPGGIADQVAQGNKKKKKTQRCLPREGAVLQVWYSQSQGGLKCCSCSSRTAVCAAGTTS